MIYGKNRPLKDTLNPITLEILKNALTAIPEEMGAALKRTAYTPSQV